VDWFNYNGIYRPVYLAITRAAWLDDYTIKTHVDGRVSIDVVIGDPSDAQTLSAKIFDALGAPIAEQAVPLAAQTMARMNVVIANPRLWNVGDAYLYTLELELKDTQGRACDRIEKKFGIREFAVAGQKILVNGKPVHLVGCSKHDEYPLTGRTVTREQLIADYNLYRRMNANFVRLCHYPHNRLEHELLNELGIVSMAEIPLVFLHEPQMTNDAMLEKAKRTSCSGVSSSSATHICRRRSSLCARSSSTSKRATTRAFS
jgi:beta-glucuronidase